MREAMIAVGDSGSCIQLLAPLNDESTIAKFLDRSGPGVQQMAYRVTDVEQVSAILRERGVRLLYDAPRARHLGLPDQLHPPEGRRRSAGRAGPACDLRPLNPVTRRVIFQTARPPNQSGAPTVQHILDAIQAGDTSSEDFANLELPESYRAVTVHKDEVDMFEGLESRDKDPRKSLHVEDVALPELGPGEALRRRDGLAINYNTVWTSIFEPVSTFGFLERYGRLSPLTKRHDLPYHVVGSDLAGVVLKTGPGVHEVEAGRRGRRPLPLGGARGPRRPQRHDARPRAADLGLRDQLRRPRRDRPGQVQPADAQARRTSPGRRRPPPAWSTPRRTASWSRRTAAP